MNPSTNAGLVKTPLVMALVPSSGAFADPPSIKASLIQTDKETAR
jgi:hypothetical protein